MRKLVLMVFILAISCTAKDDISVNPLPYFSASGYVRFADGKGVANATLNLNAGPNLKAKTIFTDANGFWMADSLLEGASIVPTGNLYSVSPRGKLLKKGMGEVVFIVSYFSYSNPYLKIKNAFPKLQLPNGLVASTPGGNNISLYDNALGAITFIALGKLAEAEKIFDFFDSRVQTELTVHPGGFHQFRDRNGNPSGDRWLGDNAWLLIALNYYGSYTSSTKYNTLKTELANWIISQQQANGSLNGGTMASGGTIGAVTEGMLDAFQAVPGYTNYHSRLLRYLRANRWDSTNRNFICDPSSLQYRLALDNFSWGFSMFLGASPKMLGNARIFYNTQTASVNGASVSGYCFDIDRDAIWPEGTMQMAVAYNLADSGTLAQNLITETEKLLIQSKVDTSFYGFPYSSNKTTGYGGGPLWNGSDTDPYLSSSAWYIMAVNRFNPFSPGYNKVIPETEVFWDK